MGKGGNGSIAPGVRNSALSAETDPRFMHTLGSNRITEGTFNDIFGRLPDEWLCSKELKDDHNHVHVLVRIVGADGINFLA
jgi:hypothetical protein